MAADGLTLLVTGSGSGVGAATVLGFARPGARIVVHYASGRAGAEQSAEQCRAAGAEVVIVQGDVSRDEDCRRIAAAASPWGRLDLLVNCAGTTKDVPNHADLEAISTEDFHHLFGVNTLGTFHMVRACRDLLEAGTRAAERTASVVNVSSLSAFNGKGSSIAYAASKGALNTLTVSLARALAPSIRVNAVVPGFIDTPWIVRRVGTVERAAKTRAKVQESMPLKLATGPEDVARVIRFLAIDATHMTGELVRIDAGNHLL